MNIETARAIQIAELAAAADAHRPTPIDMIGAPVIDGWEYSVYPGTLMINLVGNATGHPRLPAGPTITRPLLAIDTAGGWARTEGRYYHLGNHRAGRLASPAEALPQSILDRIEGIGIDVAVEDWEHYDG